MLGATRNFTGPVLLGAIGELWIVFALSPLPVTVRHVVLALSLLIVCLLLVGAKRIGKIRDMAAGPWKKYRWPLFSANLLLELALIVAAVSITQYDPYRYCRVPAISIAVGLHFFPLVRIFGEPEYSGCGAALISAAILYLFLTRGGQIQVGVGRALECAGNGIILWGTAFFQVQRERVKVRTPLT